MADIIDEPVTTLWWPADDPEWDQRGLCKVYPSVNFFPGRGDAVDTAKAICGMCEVRETCLEVALRNSEKYGIWGGTSERERRALRADRLAALGLPNTGKPRKPIKHGTYAGYAQHAYRKDPPCDLCKAAHSRYKSGKVAEWRRRKREAAAQGGDAA
jgi:WhiB family transcriptional regulator, redox-sensing transcriptional regulator